MSVDEMARVASTALHAATEPIRPIDFDRSGRRSGWRQPQLHLALGVGLVAAVVIAVIVVMANRDDGTRVATVPKDVPRLVLSTVPKGLRVTGAADLPVASAPGDPTMSFDTTLYGDDQTESWLRSNSSNGAGKRLLVLEATVSGAESSAPADGEKVVVNGQEWTVSPFGSQVSLGAVVDGRNIVLTSPGLDQTALVALAQSVRVADGAIRVDASGGLRALARSTMPPSFFLTVARGPGSGVGHVVGYQDSSDGNDVVMVSTLVASADDLAVLRADASQADPITVRGRAGWAITQVFDSGQAFHSVVWFESDGVLATVSGTRSLAELQAMAETLEVADDATWRELSQPLGVPDADSFVVLSGTSSDGRAWRVSYNANDGVCIAVQDSGRNSSSSCSTAQIGTSSSEPLGDGAIAYRIDPVGAEPVVWACSSGETIQSGGTSAVVPGATLNVYVLPAGCAPDVGTTNAPASIAAAPA